MGTVWMAEQRATGQVPRGPQVDQAEDGLTGRPLAVRGRAAGAAPMDHPNIAKILDGGTTPTSPAASDPAAPISSWSWSRAGP